MRSVAVAIAVIGCHSAPSPAPRPAVALASNMMRADYAGSAACADCHGTIYTSWAASPMRNMTRDATTATIRAPFDGAQLTVGDDRVAVVTQAGARYMQLTSPKGDHQFRITKVVGGRYREDFVGVDVTGAPDPSTVTGVERVLPATYVFSTKTWRYKGYSVMVPERPRMSFTGQWSKECITCHNTLPLATMLFDDLYGPGAPPYQGRTAERILPKTRTWSATPRDPVALVEALSTEITFLGGTPPAHPTPQVLKATLAAAATTTEAKLDGAHLVELGIGCEACHNGARMHAADPSVKPSFAALSPVVEVDPPKGMTGTKAQLINHTCAKCHTVLFSQYPWTWEGHKRREVEPGGSSISSGEGRDFQLGGCATQMACTTCHDPHVEDSPDALRAMATPAGNHLCTTCHAQYGNDDALARHSHHQLGGAGTSCVACHMAKKNMGLDYALNRYHRIGSPNDPARVESDRPLECALCHVDKSVEQLASTMEGWWGKRYDRSALKKLYGDDLGVNAMRATLILGKPHEQAVAIATYGDAKAVDAVAAIVPMLSHQYPLVRYFAQRALQNITGDPVAIDVGAKADDVKRAADAWLKAR